MAMSTEQLKEKLKEWKKQVTRLEIYSEEDADAYDMVSYMNDNSVLEDMKTAFDELEERLDLPKVKPTFGKKEVAMATVKGAAGSVATAVASGAALAAIGVANEKLRDELLARLGDSAPEWMKNPMMQQALLLVAPALILLLVDLGPQIGVPIPEKGRDAVKQAALLGLQHAGIMGATQGVKLASEILLPLYAVYADAGQHLLPETVEEATVPIPKKKSRKKVKVPA